MSPPAIGSATIPIDSGHPFRFEAQPARVASPTRGIRSSGLSETMSMTTPHTHPAVVVVSGRDDSPIRNSPALGANSTPFTDNTLTAA